jgi:hypothetical protein
MLLGTSLNCLFPRDPKQLRWGQPLAVVSTSLRLLARTKKSELIEAPYRE